MNAIVQYLAKPPTKRPGTPHDPHPGESEGKRACRAAVYNALCDAPQIAPGVILCGPQPESELETIQDEGWSLEKVLAVDSSPDALRGLNACADAGCQFYAGDIVDALAGLEQIAWFCGDFMGLSRRAMLAVEIAAKKLVPGGGVSLTYCLGRGDRDSAVVTAANIGVGETREERVHDGLGTMLRRFRRGLSAVYYGPYCRPGGMKMGVSCWRVETKRTFAKKGKL